MDRQITMDIDVYKRQGYMSMQYLVYVRDETETIEGDAPSPELSLIHI